MSNQVSVFVLLDNSFENLNENFLILYFKYSHLAWLSLIFPHLIPVNSHGFAGRLPVSMVISRSPGFWAKTIFCCFFKTITQIRFISFIYYIPWKGMTLDNFLKFSFILFSSIPLLPWCFRKKNIPPFVHSFPDQVYCYVHNTCCKIIKYRRVWKFFFGVTLEGQENLFLKYDLTSYYKVTC